MTIRSWIVWSVPLEGEPVRIGRLDAEPRQVLAEFVGFERAGARDALVLAREDDGPPVTKHTEKGSSWRANQNPWRKKR